MKKNLTDINQNFPELLENYRIIQENIASATAQIGKNPKEIRIMGVTKTVPPEKINALINAGLTLIGENRVQEYLSKKDLYLKQNLSVHFIGTLQSNKVKHIINEVDMIHSLNSENLLSEINRQAEKNNKIMDCLIEINIGNEQSKTGIQPEKLPDFIEKCKNFSSVQIKGLMAIPPFDTEKKLISKYFDRMYKLFVDNKTKMIDNISMDILSLGMSGDYQEAIKSGSNLVRLGTALFGNR